MTNNFEKFRDNERIVASIREGFIANTIPSWMWVFFIGAIVSGSAVGFYLVSWPIFMRSSVGIVIAFFLLFLIKSLIKTYHVRLTLTNRRIIGSEREGLFHSSQDELHYDQVSKVYYEMSGIRDRIMKAGHLKIEFVGGRESMIFGAISNPARIQNLILELQQEYVKHTRGGNSGIKVVGSEGEGGGYISMSELMHFVRKTVAMEEAMKENGREVKSTDFQPRSVRTAEYIENGDDIDENEKDEKT